MKILFLDIDGVCNSEETFTKDPAAYFPIDPYMAFLVGKIQLETNCRVVLSSSWRHHKESIEHVERRIVKIMDVTPDTKDSFEVRGHEIKKWLDNAKALGFFIDSYAILDDDSDMLPEQLPNFFKTSWLTGLTEEIAEEVIAHLNKSYPHPETMDNAIPPAL